MQQSPSIPTKRKADGAMDATAPAAPRAGRRTAQSSQGHSDSATPTTPTPKRDIRYFVNKAIAAAPAGSSAWAQPTRSRPNTWM